MGLLLRASAAGAIHKDRELATGGPYGHLRHPLYLGSFLLGLGLSLAGGRWWLPVIFVVLFFWLYRRTLLVEESDLLSRFGNDYEAYMREVPAFFPRIRAFPKRSDAPSFRFERFRRNREWQASLGAAIGFGLLWLRMWILE